MEADRIIAQGHNLIEPKVVSRGSLIEEASLQVSTSYSDARRCATGRPRQEPYDRRLYRTVGRPERARPMLASKICDIQRVDYSIDSSMRAGAIQMVPVRTVTSPQRPSLPTVEAHCASPPTTATLCVHSSNR